MRHLTISEAAEALQLSVPTIKRYIYDGKLRSTKLPGGQHRIPESEVERLLGDAPESPVDESAEPAAGAEARIATLERWVTELEAEVERLSGALEVMARFLGERPVRSAEVEPASAPRRLAVLGPGCRRCTALYERLQRVVRGLGRPDARVELITDLDDIVSHGPLLTPAITVDDLVVMSGRVPSEASLKRLLQGYLS